MIKTANIRKVLETLMASRRLDAVILYFIKRLYSRSQFNIVRRDLTIPVDDIRVEMPLGFRRLRQDDIRLFLRVDPAQIRNSDPLDRLRLINMFKSGFQTCYVTVLENDVPCHICWLIDSKENQRLREFFGGGIPPLAPDEILFENTFTIEPYRMRGIQSWSIHRLVEQAADMGARWAYAYIRGSNMNSFKSFKKNGFLPHMVRHDKWRMFSRTFTFVPQSFGSPAI